MGAELIVIAIGVVLLVVGILSAVVGGMSAGALLIFLAAVGTPIGLITIAVLRSGGQSSNSQSGIRQLLSLPAEKPSPPLKRAASGVREESVPPRLARKHTFPRTTASATLPKAVPSPVGYAGLDSQDFEEAWKLISTWRTPSARVAQLDAIRGSTRRPYVVLAMIRIAAVLANAADAEEALTDQLGARTYNDMEMEKGILAATDEIMRGRSESDLLVTERVAPTLIDHELAAKT